MRTPPVIWIIDSQQWPRAYLRAELIERGFEVRAFVLLSPALTALHARRVIRPSVIVLELRDQPVDRALLDELKRTRIPVVLLTGISPSNERAVNEGAWAAVMKRPLTIGSVADKIDELARKIG